ncbi:branched-chain amino acid ABC transporter permease [Nitratireductor alexandrii]|uniref:branched-chain amino acid ABC transporter permease n=1 Tax=Nitratireductor alexandrii TaxID=2448161 RepID=UPI000FDA97E0|nr:branched-chain amino acid ABC transporter permease [Nitratireductor alexandrii]
MQWKIRMLLAQQIVNGLSIGLNYALIALGLTLVFGVLHVINFGHGQVVMIGALAALYAAELLNLPYVLTLPVAAAAAGLLGVVLHLAAVRPVVRRRDGHQDVLLTTFAAGLLIHEAVLASRGPAPARFDGIPGVLHVGPLMLTNQRLFIIIVAGLTLLALLYLIRMTRFGNELRALAENEFAARAVGIDTGKVILVTFAMSAAIGGLGGALLAPLSAFSPNIGQGALMTAFVIVVAAGLGSVWGTVAFAALYGILESVLSLTFDQGMASATVSGLMLLILIARPNGLFGKA